MNGRVDLVRLAALAAAATPGPWDYDGRDIFTREHVGAAEHHLVVPLSEIFHAGARPTEDAEFIAACSPDVVAALVQAVQAAQALDAAADIEDHFKAYDRLLAALAVFGNESPEPSVARPAIEPQSKGLS